MRSPVIALLYIADMFSFYCLFTFDALVPFIFLNLLQCSFEVVMILLTVYSIQNTKPKVSTAFYIMFLLQAVLDPMNFL